MGKRIAHIIPVGEGKERHLVFITIEESVSTRGKGLGETLREALRTKQPRIMEILRGKR